MVSAIAAEVTFIAPSGSSTSQLTVTTPDRQMTVEARFTSPADGRRRALLAGLDLLRRALA
jgi:hypothetical protein